MRKTAIILFVLTTIFVLSCGQQKKDNSVPFIDSTLISLPGDSALYGLACEGSSDTLLILLTNVNANPDTFNMLEAVINRQIFGRPTAGDKLAVLLSPDSGRFVQKVINMERLKGTWCYMVTPTLRRRAGVSDEKRQHILDHMPDSLRKKWMVPKEFGFQFKANYECMPIGERIENEKNNPFVYEKPKRYREWRLQNGRLLLTAHLRDSTGNNQKTITDTADLVRLSRDTLVLEFSEGERTYYRKQ